MAHENYDIQEKHGMSPFMALLTGLGIGIVGTVVVIAANERKFHRVVEVGRLKAREVGNSIRDRFDEAIDDVRDGAYETADKVERTAGKVKSSLRHNNT